MREELPLKTDSGYPKENGGWLAHFCDVASWKGGAFVGVDIRICVHVRTHVYVFQSAGIWKCGYINEHNSTLARLSWASSGSDCTNNTRLNLLVLFTSRLSSPLWFLFFINLSRPRPQNLIQSPHIMYDSCTANCDWSVIHSQSPISILLVSCVGNVAKEA